MIYYINFDGVGHLPCSILKRSPIGALASLVGNAMNMAYQSGENERNRDFSREMFERQSGRQAYVNATAALTQKQSLKSAGLSPNMMAGSPPYSASVPLGDSSSQQAPQMDVASIASLLQNQPLVDANAKLANANAEAQEIQNEREKHKDKAASSYLMDKKTFDNSLSEDLKSIGVDPSVCGLNSDNVLSNVVVGSKPQYNMGDFDFKQMSASYEHNLKQYDADDARWALEKMVHKAQKKDAQVIEALTKLPKAQLEQLAAATKDAISSASLHDAQTVTEGSRKALFDAQEAYQKLQTQIAEDSNLSQIFDTIMKEGLSFENVGKMLIAAFVQWMKPR